MSHLVHGFAAVLAVASLLTVRRHRRAHSGGLVTIRANRHHLRDEQRRVLLDNSRLHHPWVGLGMALDDVDAGHDDPVLPALLVHHTLDLAAFAAVLARD